MCLLCAIGTQILPCLQNLLRFVDANREGVRTLIRPVLKVQAFMMQVRLGLWKRNGEEVLKLQRIYNTAMWFWHEISWELDDFLIKCWLAVEDEGRSLSMPVSQPQTAGPASTRRARRQRSAVAKAASSSQ